MGDPIIKIVRGHQELFRDLCAIVPNASFSTRLADLDAQIHELESPTGVTDDAMQSNGA